jgi:signal transduction histidine kinase
MKMAESFRLRMFLLTALIVAAVLLAVAMVSGSTFYSFEVRRLDGRLCDESWRLDQRPPQAGQQERFAQDVAGKLRLQSTGQLLMTREARDGRGSARYGNWPIDFDPGQLAWSDSTSRPECRVTGFDSDGRQWRAARITTPGSQSVIAADLSAIQAELWQALQKIAATVGPIAFLMTIIGAWVLSGLALRPINQLRESMKSVDERALDRRLPTKREAGEFRELIASYNGMLERLEASFHQASRFSADAAHELKTPLTILRGQLEREIPRAATPELQASLAEMLEEVGRLVSISRKLLLLSQADAGRLALRRVSVDLSAMLRDRIADARMLELTTPISSAVADGLRIRADEELLGQVLNNLLGNALRYTPPGGRIDIRAQATTAGVEVWLSNSTRPIPQVDRARFFERFYRGDPSRNRGTDGHGLGLSLSQVIARAHGGELVLEPSAESEVVLRLTLPNGTEEAS